MKENKDLNIEISENVATGIYSTGTIVNYSPSEFILDFIQFLPGVKPNVKSRIILSPLQVKNLMYMLKQNIEIYEKDFGVITKPDINNLDSDVANYNS